MSLVLAMLADSCTITPRASAVGSLSASPVVTDGTPVTGVACAIQAMSSREAARYGRDQSGETTLWGFFAFYPVLYSGTAKAGAASTVTLADGTTLATNQLAGYQVRILSGTGAGQHRTIVSNTNTNVVTVSPAWTTVPDSTSTYEVRELFILHDFLVTPTTGHYASRALGVIGPPLDKAGVGDHLQVPLAFVEGGPVL